MEEILKPRYTYMWLQDVNEVERFFDRNDGIPGVSASATLLMSRLDEAISLKLKVIIWFFLRKAKILEVKKEFENNGVNLDMQEFAILPTP